MGTVVSSAEIRRPEPARAPVKVGIIQAASPSYPGTAPFHPSVCYPEYPFGDHLSAEPNAAYDAVRQLLRELQFDAEHFDRKCWNPLGHLIRPGMKVVIKPNFVLSRHPEGKDVYSVITHPSVLRAIADYAWIALGGCGHIVIADAPQFNCKPLELIETTRIDEVVAFYRAFAGPRVRFRDLRSYWSAKRHMDSMLRPLAGDPEGVVRIDLGPNSALHGHPRSHTFYGANYHRAEIIRHHSGARQVYEVSRTMLDCDVFISVPKLKTHKKVGVTLNAKGLVGITTNKNLCVHYTLGSPSQGGDQFPDGLFTPMELRLIALERWMYDHLLASGNALLERLHRAAYWLHGRLLKPLGIVVDPSKRLLDAGNWYGNDSAWRMVADLLQIIHYADRDGRMHSEPQRRFFSVVDGIIGGENNGPLSPDPKPAGILLGGESLLAVDLVATRVMGFDPMKLKQFSILQDSRLDFGFRSLRELDVSWSKGDAHGCLDESATPLLAFRPHPGWEGHIEVGGGSCG